MSRVKPRRVHGYPSIKKSFTPRMKRFTLIPAHDQPSYGRLQKRTIWFWIWLNLQTYWTTTPDKPSITAHHRFENIWYHRHFSFFHFTEHFWRLYRKLNNFDKPNRQPFASFIFDYDQIKWSMYGFFLVLLRSEKLHFYGNGEYKFQIERNLFYLSFYSLLKHSDNRW